MANKYVSMRVSSTEEDVNFDGVPDIIDIRLTANGVERGNDIHGVKLMMQFSYIVDESRIDMRMKSLAYASYASPLPGVGLYIDGTVCVKEASLINIHNNSSRSLLYIISVTLNRKFISTYQLMQITTSHNSFASTK